MHVSERKKVLQALRETNQSMQLARYLELIDMLMDDDSSSEITDESESDNEGESESSSSGSDISSNISMESISSVSSTNSFDTWMSLDSIWDEIPSSDSGTDASGPVFSSRAFTEFSNTIQALEDEVEKARTLVSRPKATHAPQLHLLDEWRLENPRRFRRKLRVDPEVFVELVNRIIHHPVFYNNSNNPQLPVPVQLAVFLNGIGHYGNAATAEDMADWAGVSVGTVYNCYRRVMVAILQHHDNVIHFDPLEAKDQIEKDRAKDWVEERTCSEWRGGFLCVDGTPFNVYQKPGWHGEGFFDRKSNYSLSAQVSDREINFKNPY
jgi:hypothetical protein